MFDGLKAWLASSEDAIQSHTGEVGTCTLGYEHDRDEAIAVAEPPATSQPEARQDMSESEDPMTSSRVGLLSWPCKPRRRTKGFLTNFGLILAFGILGCGWIRRYTDWFEIVGGLLPLGGAFTWLAFVLKIVERFESVLLAKKESRRS
jgi:hypothetical protein